MRSRKTPVNPNGIKGSFDNVGVYPFSDTISEINDYPIFSVEIAFCYPAGKSHARYSMPDKFGISARVMKFPDPDACWSRTAGSLMIVDISQTSRTPKYANVTATPNVIAISPYALANSRDFKDEEAGKTEERLPLE